MLKEVARRISGAVAGEACAKSSQDIPSIHHKLLSLALHYLPFASRIPLPHFTLAVLFALSFRSPRFRLLLVCSFLVRFVAIMSETGEVIIEKGGGNDGETLMLFITLMKNLLLYTLKSFGLAVVILLEKELFKISLLVPVLCPLWEGLFFIELVV